MSYVEIICATTSSGEREAAIEAVAPFCRETEVRVRVYRHELHSTDLAVHVFHLDAAAEQADWIGERITRVLETHGFVSRAKWREARMS